MPACGAANYGPETRDKHEQLGGLFRMYAQIIRSLALRGRLREFVYIDLYSGPGQYDHGAVGSPLLAAYAFHDLDCCTMLHCFEQDADTYSKLTASTASFDKLIAHHLTNREGIALPALRNIPRGAYGLVFSDPNPCSENIPIDVLQTVANRWPFVDILCYVSAATVKRIRTAHGGSTLREQLGRIGKKGALIRKPEGKHQWTFVLLTNWEGFPEWRRAGWVRMASPEGQRILELLDETKRETHAKRNPLLFQDDE